MIQKDIHLNQQSAYSKHPSSPSQSTKIRRRLNTIPAGLTNLVGRAEERQTLSNMLLHQRLITLVGPGGVGKTRLAMAVAEQNQAHFKHGVCYIPLVAVTTNELLITSIASALDFTFYGHEKPLDQLINHLQSKHMLLVLDNFEQLLAATSILTSILKQAPDIHLLVTSRERLNCYGEQTFVVDALPFPKQATELLTDTHSAVQLFVERARSVCPTFKLTKDNQQQIIRICQLVGGLPLALELAATWVKILSCAEIAEELSQNLDFLSTTLSGVPERHRTLRIVFINSWKRLTMSEQQVFCALCTFSASFTRAAAKAIAQATLSNLASLIDQSFLQQHAPGRYEIHPILKQYGQEKLTYAMDAQIYKERHCVYYMDFLHEKEIELYGKGHKQTLRTIEREIKNIRQAWWYATEQYSVDNLTKGLDGLYYFFERENRLSEGITLFRGTIEQLCQSKPRTKQQDKIIGRLQIRLGALHNHLFAYEPAQKWLEQGAETAQETQDSDERAFALSELARLYLRYEQYGKARKLSQDSYALYEQLGHEVGMSTNLLILGMLAQLAGDYDKALDQFDTAWSLAQSERTPTILQIACLWQMALVVGIYHRDYAKAISYAEHSLTISQEAELWLGTGTSFNTLGFLWSQQGDYAKAKFYYEQYLNISKELGIQANVTKALVNLGNISLQMHNYAECTAYLNEALSLAETSKRKHQFIALVNKGFVLAQQGDYDSAQTYLVQTGPIIQEYEGTEIEAAKLVSHGFIAYQQQDYQQTQAYCQQALKILSAFPDHDSERLALIYLAHAQVEMGQLNEAAAMYQQALNLIKGLSPHLALEPLAGLAALSLAQKDLTQALAYTERVLVLLRDETILTDYVPLFVYWHCYRVLSRCQDTRPDDLLNTAYRILQERAERTDNEQLRQSFLQQVPVNEAIQRIATHGETVKENPTMPVPASLIEPLTQRETEVLRLAAGGLTNKEIAEQLVVSIHTVKRHLTNIYQKLHVSNRRQAVRLARQQSLL
jgi:predicted ATPase/DNA-binding CsgD family transcriptional regulator